MVAAAGWDRRTLAPELAEGRLTTRMRSSGEF